MTAEETTTVVNKEPKKVYGSYLEDRIVEVKPVESGNKWQELSSKGQELKNSPFLLNKAKRSYQVPLMGERHGGGVKNILDDQRKMLIKKYEEKFPEGMTQREFFEAELGIDLNYTAPIEKNFWRTDKRSRVMLTKEGTKLNLNLTIDMLRYLILLSDTQRICAVYENRANKVSYEFVMVDGSKILSKKLEETNIKKRAYIKFGEITSNVEEMKGFIRSLGRAIPANHTEDWLQNEIVEVMEASPSRFLDIVNHPHYKQRVFVQRAIEVGAILKMNEKRFTLDNGAELGDLTDTINYLGDAGNQEVRLRIKAKIELADKK
jgi:hypothetical protein